MFQIVSELAWCQHGAFSTAQAEAAGVSRTWLSRRCSAGDLIRSAPGVYTMVGSPASRRRKLMVHLLAAGQGAKATGDSALGLRCPELVLPSRPVIAVPRNCGYRTKSARVIRSRDLEHANGGSVDGVPAVGVARALLDASIGRSPEEVVALINACQRHDHLSVKALVHCLDLHARRGRPGLATFREALGMLTESIPDSDFERMVMADLERAGLTPRLHHTEHLPGHSPITLDIDFPGCRLDVELDGRDHQARMAKFQRDRQRDRALQAAGYLVVRYTWRDYVSKRDLMIEEIRGFVEQRRSLASPSRVS